MYFPTDETPARGGDVFISSAILRRWSPSIPTVPCSRNTRTTAVFRRHFHNKSFEVRSVPPIITTVPRPLGLGKLIEDTLNSESNDSGLQEESSFETVAPSRLLCIANAHWYTTSTIQRWPRTRALLLRWITWESVSYRAMRVRGLSRRQTSTATGSFTPWDVTANGISLGPRPSLTSKFRTRPDTP